MFFCFLQVVNKEQHCHPQGSALHCRYNSCCGQSDFIIQESTVTATRRVDAYIFTPMKCCRRRYGFSRLNVAALQAIVRQSEG